MIEQHERYMRLALGDAAKGKEEGNLAVGSVIVRDDSVVARGRNLVATTHDVTAHAETVALREATAMLGRSDLSDCTLYTTFEPCPMCCGAIMASGIQTIVMGARINPADARYGDYALEKLIEMAGQTEQINVVTGIMIAECADIRL